MNYVQQAKAVSETPKTEPKTNAGRVNTVKQGRPISDEETKSKRVNLLMYPSLYEDLTKVANIFDTSINDLINTLAREYVEQNEEAIKAYDKLRSKFN